MAISSRSYTELMRDALMSYEERERRHTQAEEFVRHGINARLREAFAQVLQQVTSPEHNPHLRRVRANITPQGDIDVRVHFDNRPQLGIRFHVHRDIMCEMGIIPVGGPGTQNLNITPSVERLWNEMLEDHLVELDCAASRLALEAAERAGASAQTIMNLAHAYHQRQEMARYHYARGRSEAGWIPYREPVLGEVGYIDGTQPIEPMTATEVRARYENDQRRRAQEEYLRDCRRTLYENITANNPLLNRYRDPAAAWFSFGEPGSDEARQRGMALLMDNLTPEQKATYEKHKWFEVKGSKTGKTYRIKHGRSQNIYELDKPGGKEVKGWCFLPSGGLVVGDVLVGQKNALEVCEEKALKVANPFPVFGGDSIDDYLLTADPVRIRGFAPVMREEESNAQD